MSISRFFPLVLAALALTACGTDDESPESAEHQAAAEQTEATEDADTTDAQTTDQPQATEPAGPADAPGSDETAQAAEADDPADEVTVEYVATAEGAGQVAAGFGDHEFIDFTDEWTDTEETDAMNASMSTEADQGPATCEIIVDGESLVAEEDESGSVYCSAVIP